MAIRRALVIFAPSDQQVITWYIAGAGWCIRIGQHFYWGPGTQEHALETIMREEPLSPREYNTLVGGNEGDGDAGKPLTQT